MTETKKRQIDHLWQNTDIGKYFNSWAKYNRILYNLQDKLHGEELDTAIEKLNKEYTQIKNSIIGNLDKYPPPLFFGGFQKEMAEKIFGFLPTEKDFQEYIDYLRNKDEELAEVFGYHSELADFLIKKYTSIY